MTVPGNIDALLLGGQRGYQIERSLRFNSADSAYLVNSSTRTTAAGAYTFSFWIKRCALGNAETIWSSEDASGASIKWVLAGFGPDNIFYWWHYSSADAHAAQSNGVLRDTSAWYHIVLSKPASAAGTLYINGVAQTKQTSFTADSDAFANAKYIGRRYDGTQYSNCYLTEFYGIDGQALTPSSFGETDTITGVWKPKRYAGTYGTNGFYLKFADNSGTTSTTLGKDSSGNSNNWTPNNFAVTPVTGYLLPGADIVNGTGMFGNSTLPAVGNGTNAFHFPKTNATYTLSRTLTATTKIEAYCYIDGPSGPTIQANGGSVITMPAGSSYAWSKVNLGVTSLSSITLSAASWTSRDPWFSCFIVDDVVVYGTPALAVGNDSSADSPTSYGVSTGNGSELRGNYATLSPIITSAQGTATLTNGNLDLSGSGSNFTGALSSIAMSSGKWYWEYFVNNVGSSNGVGIIATTSLAGAVGGGYGYAAVSDAWLRSLSYVISNNTTVVTGLGTVTTGDVVMVAVDFDSGKLWFGRNGTWDSSGNPSAGTNPTITFTVGGKSFYACAQGYWPSGTWSGSINFGQRQWNFVAPTGFNPIVTTSLPEPSIKKPSSYMDVLLYTGNATARSITGLGFSPDFVWTKVRSSANDHKLYDAVRGATKVLESSNTGAEGTDTQGLTAFNSDGFSLGTASSSNANGSTYVAWCWDESATPGFDIVTFTGNGSAPATISHSLGVAPKMMIVKNRDQTGDFVVYHSSITNSQTGGIFLNLTSAWGANSTYFNNSVPTSSNFQVGGYFTGNNIKYVAYLWSEVAGFSKFGSYTGNGLADGPFVFTGMRPRWIMVKRSDSTANWTIRDTARRDYNSNILGLFPNLSSAEDSTAGRDVDMLSNGFKIRGTDTDLNASGGTYVFAAFSESAFKYSLAR